MKKSQKKFIESAYLDKEVCEDYKSKIEKHFPKIVEKIKRKELPKPGDYVDITHLSNGCQGCPTGVYKVLSKGIEPINGLAKYDKGFNVLVGSSVWKVNGKFTILSKENVLRFKIEEINRLADLISNYSVDITLNYETSGCSSTPFGGSIGCR